MPRAEFAYVWVCDRRQERGEQSGGRGHAAEVHARVQKEWFTALTVSLVCFHALFSKRIVDVQLELPHFAKIYRNLTNASTCAVVVRCSS